MVDPAQFQAFSLEVLTYALFFALSGTVAARAGADSVAAFAVTLAKWLTLLFFVFGFGTLLF